MRRRRSRLLLATLAVSAIAAGCGSDDGSEETLAASSLDKAAYVEQVDEICARDRRKTSAQLEAYVAAHRDSGQGGQDTLTKATRAILLPSLQTKIDEIRSLGAPSGDEEQVEAFLRAMQQTVDDLDEKQLSTLNDFAVELKPAADLGREYGFTTCG